MSGRGKQEHGKRGRKGETENNSNRYLPSLYAKLRAENPRCGNESKVGKMKGSEKEKR